MAESQAAAGAGEATASPAESAFDSIDSFEIVNGQLEPIFREDQEEGNSQVEPDAGEAAEAAPEVPSNEWERKYQELSDRAAQETTRLREELSYLKGHIEARKPEVVPNAPKEDEDIDIFEVLGDRSKRDQWISGEVNRRVEEHLAKWEPHLAELSLQSELRGAMEKYPDFMAMQPKIAKVYEAFPGEDIPFERAYALAKRFFGSEAAAAPDSRKVDMAALQERAAKVNPETGVAGAAVGERAPREAGDFAEAFEMALKSTRRN